jgi:hypothetical protein
MTAIETVESSGPPPGLTDDVGYDGDDLSDKPIMFNGTLIEPGIGGDKLLEIGFYDLNDPQDKEDYEFLKGIEDEREAYESQQREAAEKQRLQRELHPEPEEPLEMTSHQRKQLEFNMTHMGMDELVNDPFTQWVKQNHPNELKGFLIPEDFPGLRDASWTMRNPTTLGRHSKATVVLTSTPPKHMRTYNPNEER